MCTRAPAGSVHTSVEHRSTLRRTIRGTRSTKTWLSVLATDNASLLLFAASSSGALVRRCCVRCAPGTACSSLPSDTWTGCGRADLDKAPLPAASGGGGSCQANDSWLTAMWELTAPRVSLESFLPLFCRFQIPDARSALKIACIETVSWEAALQGALVEIPLVEELADLLGDARVRLRLRILRLSRIPQLAQQKLSLP